MSGEAQRVVVIQDASRDVSPTALRWVLHALALKPGDQLTLLAVLHQVNNPMGYRSKIDSGSMFGANKKIIMDEVGRKLEEYGSNAEIIRISTHCDIEKIEFHIEVHVGSSPKTVALKAVRSLKATWVILDRQMKKDKKYFMERLSCGISRMKRDNSIEQLRGPTEKGNLIFPTDKNATVYVKYDDMIPGKEANGPSAKTTASNFTKAKPSPVYFQEEENTTPNTEHETASEQSPFSISQSQERGQIEVYNEGSTDEHQNEHSSNYVNNWMGGFQQDKIFKSFICSACKNRRPKIGWTKDFTYAELQAATEGFSPKNFLSEGGFGSVFKGELNNGLKIAVKQHKNISFQGEKEFKSEVHVLSKAKHENLVMLLGSCSEGSQRLLVYEYVCNGSLDQHLSKHARTPLSWEKRMKIAMGAAKGLQYLHENNIIHRDMRPNNILITHDHESLLGDFGLARAHEDSDHSLETRVVGTLGYLAPEYAECGKVSTKMDVYSFGVVLLQLITGLRTTDKILGGKSLVGWARPLLKERNYPDLIDHRILDSHDVHQLFWMVRVAEKCLNKDPQKRLTMEKVVEALKYIMEGKAANGVVDFSPAQSVSSLPDSSESPGDEGSSTTQTISISSLATSFDSFTTASSSSTSQKSTGRLPPTPPVKSSGRSSISSNIYGQASLGGGKDQGTKSNMSRNGNI